MIAQAEQLLQRGSSVTSSLLPAIFNIFSQWRLTGAQQMTLLGLSNEKTLYNWKSQPEKAKLTRDLLERASYILGIYKSLQILLPDQVLADQWLATPNDNPLFNGTAPLDRILAGQVVDLAVVRDFLDAERGWLVIAIDTLPSSEVNEPVYRVILSRYPQINLFERVSNPQDWEVLYAVESLTNPRLRDEVGDIRLVPPEDRVYGDGASWIMAAFTHPPVDGRGGRFNRDFGIYYCAADEAVAIAESSFHRARFLRESRIDKTTQEMRVIRAQLGQTTLHDVRRLVGHAIYHPDDYGEAQQLGYALRDAKSFGVHYQSVRAQGECYGVMRARALSDAIHWRYLRYHYDQGTIVDVESLDGSGRR